MRLRTILAAALLLRLAHALLTPAWQAPDEFPHYWVAQTFAHTGALPAGSSDFPAYEAYQHPLYYAILAGVLAAGGAGPLSFEDPAASLPMPLLVARLFSVLCGLVTVAATWHFVRRLRPDRSDLPPVAAGFAAFLPSFVGVSATVNNDVLVVALTSVALLLALPPVRPEKRGRVCAAGCFAGAALATKLTAGIISLPFAWSLWRFGPTDSRAPLRALLILPGIALGLALVIGRNLLTYGAIFALPFVAGEPEFSFAALVHALRNLAGSFWIAFGRTYEIHPDPWIYVAAGIPLMLLPLIGWWRSRRDPLVRRDIWIVSVTILLAVAASLFFTLRSPEGMQTSWGKNLYPVLPLLAYAFALGWSDAIPRLRSVLPAALLSLLAGGAVWHLLRPLF